MNSIDWWSWKCARCGWELRSITSEPQYAAAQALICLHLLEHSAPPAGVPQNGRSTQNRQEQAPSISEYSSWDEY